MKRAIVIDGNSLVYRMFYATYSLAEYSIEHNQQPVNALKLMIDTIFRLLKNNYSYCLVAFDYGKKTLRHEVYKEYKSGRKKMPDSLVTQIPLIKEAMEYLGLNVMSQEGIEADDLIGSFSKLMSDNKITVDIYSSDKDMLQLVNEYVNVNLLKTGISDIVVNTLSNFANLNYGLLPSQIVDFKGIVGDSSDNLPGVKGIGLKTCIKLLEKYQNLENIYQNLDDLSEVNKNKFLNSKDNAFLCKQLATIDSTLFNEKSIEVFKFKTADLNSLKAMIKKYHINGLDKYFPNHEEQMKLF